MNFIWFVLATIFFYVFYWYILSLIIFLPSVPIMGFIGYLTEHMEKKWAKIALVPTFIMSFLLGILLPSALFGMGVGVITLNFAEKATYPLIYFLLGGLGAFTISAPSGETSLPAMLISLATYVITVRIPKFALFSAVTIGSLANMVLWGVGLLIFVGIAFGVVKFIVGFLDRRISKRTEIEIELKRETGRKLSIGVYILSIIFIVLGGLWVISYLIYPTGISLGYFIWGVPYLVGGIGMLRRKYWALRFSQVFLILIALQGIVAIPIGLLGAEELNLLVILILLFILFVFIGLPIWFLFRRSTVNQFKKSVKDSKNKDREKETDDIPMKTKVEKEDPTLADRLMGRVTEEGNKRNGKE